MKRLSAALSAVLLSAVLAICLSSCQNGGDTNNIYVISGSSAAKEENKNFESLSIPLVSGTDDNVLATVFARVYDKNEYIPYTGVRYWLEYVCDVKIEGMSYSDGEYTITGTALGKSFPLVVNVKDSSIYCPTWAGFLQPDPSLRFGGGTMIDTKKAYDGQKAATFYLGKYGFNIYGGIDDAYAPICVMNQLFASPLRNLQILYNGKKLYQYSGTENYTTFKDSPWYADLNKRPAALVEASYNLLCLAHDYLYGCPGYYGFADDGNGYAKSELATLVDKLPFDTMLTLYDPQTKILLKSASYADYLKGLAKLTHYTYGDQHASVKWRDFIMFDNEEIKSAVYDIIENGCSGKWKYDRKKSSIKQTNSLNWWRKEKGIVGADGELKSNKILELIDGGKTLIIRFDGFSLNQAGGWNSYYATATAEPDPDTVAMPNDTITLFYKAFYYILHKSGYENVTTVLIDGSCNGGGAKPVMQYILYLITGRGDLYYDDVHTGAKNHEITKADLNLDGIVDDNDAAYRARLFGTRSATCRGLNVAILTSFNAFSCGNALPFYAKERGVKIIGERSGGGSCIVGHGITADGFPYHFSVNSRLSAQDFSKTVEGGAEVDKPLLSGGSYEWFYDYDNPSSSHLIAALKELFGSSY
ncbi:MAG: hypothetical protein IJS51_09560 [Treponema sp.]|nr:hypothetical protein [Treponema sp.]